MICGHTFQQGVTCNREISYRMGFKLGMCASCYQLTQKKRRTRIEDEEIEARRLAKERAVYEKNKEDAEVKRRESDRKKRGRVRKKEERRERKKDKKESEKKVVSVAIRHRHSKLGVRY